MNTQILAVEENVTVRSIITFNPTSSKWAISNTSEGLIGVVVGQHTESENSRFMYVVFSGELDVITGGEIPAQGGGLSVINGQAHISDSLNGRYILPSNASTQVGEFRTIKL